MGQPRYPSAPRTMTDCGRAVFIHSPPLFSARSLGAIALKHKKCSTCLERETVSIVSDEGHEGNGRGAFGPFLQRISYSISYSLTRHAPAVCEAGGPQPGRASLVRGSLSWHRRRGLR